MPHLSPATWGYLIVAVIYTSGAGYAYFFAGPWAKRLNTKLFWTIYKPSDVYWPIACGILLYTAQCKIYPHILLPIFQSMHWTLPDANSTAKPDMLPLFYGSTIGPVAEEVFFRGILLLGGWMLLTKYVLTKHAINTIWKSLLLSFMLATTSILFGLGHSQYLPIGRIACVLDGLGFGVFAFCRKSCAQSAVMHASVNASILARALLRF